jgi:PqqD family protein of HPr-rel-A system
MIDSDTIISTADRLTTAHLDGEAIVLDTSSGQYFGVNELGARILELIDTPVALGDIHRSLLNEYDVEAEQLEADVRMFIDQLHSKGLVSLDS